MATSIASFLQGGGQPAVPGVAQASSDGSTLQGSSPTLQGSSAYLQGSSPNLQPAANPSSFPPSTVIHQPAPASTTLGSVPAPPNPNATPAPAVVDKSNDINQNLSALDATKSLLSGGLSSIKGALASLLGRYDTEASSNQTSYNDQSTTNKGNFLKNVQSALLNAAQGRQGLFGVLASLGALNGSGLELANRAVQSGANQDISGANDNFATNQGGLDSGYGAFKSADQVRRDEAAKAEVEAEKALQAQVAGNQQTIYGNLANDYADMGNSGQAKAYSDLLAALFPTIAANAVPATGPTYTAAGYTPAPLSRYISGGTTVSSTPANGTAGVPGLAAYIAPTKKVTA